MKIQTNGEEKISVTLTKTDMTDFDITYDELDYSNIETRRVIWTILDHVKKTLGKPVNIDNRLLIQVSPADDGGCRLDFTQLPEMCDNKRKRLIMKKDGEPILFCAFDDNAFIDCMCHIKHKNAPIKYYHLFSHDGKYYSLLYPEPRSTEKLIFSLSEFGEATLPPKKDIALLYEYGRALS
jgi:negative regulator of genetic competence, sporulation and motility